MSAATSTFRLSHWTRGICTYECTWCARCVEVCLHDVCPNCGGELVRRPVPPPAALAEDPPSTRRVHSSIVVHQAD